MAEDFKGSSRDLIKVLFQHFPLGVEEDYKSATPTPTHSG
jgi:hypothetical protein